MTGSCQGQARASLSFCLVRTRAQMIASEARAHCVCACHVIADSTRCEAAALRRAPARAHELRT
eukprot:2686428-Pleurochrysis_carterae.AAC.1